MTQLYVENPLETTDIFQLRQIRTKMKIMYELGTLLRASNGRDDGK